MTTTGKKIAIIIIPIIFCIICIAIAILYLTTDFLKSDKTLFTKYFIQNIDAAKIVINNKSEKEYKNLVKQNKCESTCDISSIYTENINTSEENKNNDINKIKINIDSQDEYLNNYSYKNVKLKYNDSSILRTEYIHDGDKYGIRFPEKFNQFLTVENHDLKQVATNASLSKEQVNIIPDKIEEYDYIGALSFSDEEIESLKNTYLRIIDENVPKEKYSSQKNALITVNEQSITTNAYSLTLTIEQANNLYIKILEQLENDEIIINKLSQISPFYTIFNLVKEDEEAYNDKALEEKLKNNIQEKIEEIRQNNMGTSEVKITVYQKNGTTVRTQITEEAKDIILDFDIKDNDNINVNLLYNIPNQEQENRKTIAISKTNNEEKTSLLIEGESIQGGTAKILNITREKSMNEQNIDTNTSIKYNDGEDNLLQVKINNNVTLNNEFERKVILDDKNNLIINNYDGEIVTRWIEQVKDYLNEVKTNNVSIINNIKKVKPIEKLFDTKMEVVEPEPVMTTEVDKNRFNAKFEFYTGKEKKGEEVKKLLEEAKNSIQSAQVSYRNEGNTEGTKKLQSIKLIVGEDAQKPEYADSIKEMIEDSKTYAIEIEKNSSGLITNVIITVNNN